MREQRARRHAMKHEGEPTDEIINIGLKFGSAGVWFVFLVPIGFLVALIIVEILQ